MMAVRWNVFTFHAQIAPSERKDLLPCGRCFSELVWGKMKAIASKTKLFYNLPRVTTSNHNNTMKIM